MNRSASQGLILFYPLPKWLLCQPAAQFIHEITQPSVFLKNGFARACERARRVLQWQVSRDISGYWMRFKLPSFFLSILSSSLPTRPPRIAAVTWSAVSKWSAESAIAFENGCASSFCTLSPLCPVHLCALLLKLFSRSAVTKELLDLICEAYSHALARATGRKANGAIERIRKRVSVRAHFVALAACCAPVARFGERGKEMRKLRERVSLSCTGRAWLCKKSVQGEPLDALAKDHSHEEMWPEKQLFWWLLFVKLVLFADSCAYTRFSWNLVGWMRERAWKKI